MGSGWRVAAPCCPCCGHSLDSPIRGDVCHPKVAHSNKEATRGAKTSHTEGAGVVFASRVEAGAGGVRMAGSGTPSAKLNGSKRGSSTALSFRQADARCHTEEGYCMRFSAPCFGGAEGAAFQSVIFFSFLLFLRLSAAATG